VESLSMADLLPSGSDASGPIDDDPRVIGMDSDDADAVLSALASETAREILTTLHDEPATPAAVAAAVDTSLQNAQYHLERMAAAGVIDVADTAYSEKGREMDVYAPADGALVVVAGSEDDSTGLAAALSRLLGGVGVLGLASVALDRLLRRPGGPVPGFTADGGTEEEKATNVSLSTTVTERAADGGAEATRTAAESTGTPTGGVESVTPEATRFATEATAQAAGGDLLAAVAGSPGTLFFLGGFVVLLAGFVAWTLRNS
jgi:DNA-binding transcriptional ArsR family regulator